MLYVESASVIQTTLFPLNTNIPAANHDISYEIVSLHIISTWIAYYGQ